LLTRLQRRQEWQFFGVLHKADPSLAAAWFICWIELSTEPAISFLLVDEDHWGLKAPSG